MRAGAVEIAGRAPLILRSSGTGKISHCPRAAQRRPGGPRAVTTPTFILPLGAARPPTAVVVPRKSRPR